MNNNIAWCCNAIAWVFVILGIVEICGIIFGNGFTDFFGSLGLGDSRSSIRFLQKLSVLLLGGAATFFFKLADKIKKK